MEISQFVEDEEKGKNSAGMLDDHPDVKNTKLAPTGWTGTSGAQPGLRVHPGLFLSVGKPELGLLLVKLNIT